MKSLLIDFLKRATLKAVLLVSLIMSTQLLWSSPAQAAPGDFLFLFGAQQHLADATAVAVDVDGNVFVTLPDNVQVFNSEGKRIRKWGSFGSGDGQFSYPGGIAVGPDGRVYVADTGNERVEVFSSDGTFIANWRNANWSTDPPASIATDRSGHVYVVAGGKINVFDADGNNLGEVATTHPGNIATDSYGNLYVIYYNNDVDRTNVDIFNSSHQLVRTQTLNFDQVVSGRAIAVAGNGTIYIAGTDSADFAYVAVYDSSWTFVRYLTYLGPYSGFEHYWIPIALAADAAGDVFTVDSVDDGVMAFDSSGNLLPQWWTYGGELGWFSVPQGMAFDSSGKFYETDALDPEVLTWSNRVQIFTADGTPLAKWTLGADSASVFCQTSSLAISGSNNIYVLDSNSTGCSAHSVALLLDTSGNVVQKLGTSIENQNFFGIALEKTGNFLVTDTGNSLVRVFDSNGNLVRTFGSPGTANGQFQNPEGIAIDGNGNIFIADSGNNRIQMFNSSYAFVRKWGGAGSGNGYFSHPAGIALDGAGHVLVADYGNNRIQVFNTSGTFVRAWGSLGEENGQFKKPRGVIVNKAGDRVYVADSGNNRIEVFEGFGTAVYSVSGTVRQGSATGPALSGATVSIAGKTATTGSTGAFSFTGIPAGTYTVTISKSGYVTKKITGFVVNGNVSGVVFYLVGPYSISGTVRQGSTTGPVLAGATVTVDGRTATTSSTGTFSITGLAAGTYTLTISKTGYVTKTITGYYISGNKSGVVFYLQPSYSISGVVRSGSTSGPVLPGATVSYAGKTTTTDSTGAFSLSGIAAGSYTLTISKSGYATKTVTGYYISSNKSGLVFYLTPLYTLSGTVRQGSSTGPVLAGATVSIAGKTATTSSTGTFSISGIAAGTYTLTISKTGYTTKTITGYVINSNKSGQVFYLVVAPGYTIGGTIRQGSSTGPVLSGATVSIAGKTTTTSSTGTFSIAGVTAGTYTVTISKAGYVTKTISGFVVDRNMSGLGYYLVGPYWLAGTVRQGSATGPVLAGATLSMAGRTATTSSTGTFALTNVPAGTFTLTISKTGYVTKTFTSYVVTGSRSGLVFYLTQ